MSFIRIRLIVVGLVVALLAMGSWAQGQPPQVIRVPEDIFSIQKAIDMIAKGGTILLAPGIWEENLVIGKSLTLRGEGKEPKEVRIVGVKKGHPVIRIESEGEIEVQLKNLTAAEAKGNDRAVRAPQRICPAGLQALGKAKVLIKDVQVSKNRYGLVVLGSAQVSLSNSTVSNNGWHGLKVWGSAQVSLTNSQVSNNRLDGLAVWGSATVSLSHSTISDNGLSGLAVGDSAQVSLSNSQVSKNKGSGLWVKDSATVSLSNSQVSKNEGSGLQVKDSATVSLSHSTVSNNRDDGLNVWDLAKVELEDNVIKDNKSCGIYVGSAEAQVRGGPQEMHGNGVDLCGYASAGLRKPRVSQTDRIQLSVPEDYSSLQEAIDAVAPGGKITVEAGSYAEGLTIWKPLKLVGAGRGQTILKVLPECKVVISIIAEAQGVMLEGLTVTGSKKDGLLIYGRAELQDLQVSNNGGCGLTVGARSK